MSARRYQRLLPILLAFLVTACSLAPAPTPEPPTPTPRARAEQIAQMTQVAARITATAEARALPTATTLRATVVARPSLSGHPVSGQSFKATPIEWNPAPLVAGRRFRDPAGQFDLSIPDDWEEIPPSSHDFAGFFIGPPEPDDRVIELKILVWEMPQVNWVLPLSDITNMSMAEVREYLGEDYAFMRLERIEANGLQIDRLICRDTADEYRIVQAYLVVGHTLHILTFHSSAEQFEVNLALFDAILASYSPTSR